MKLVRAAGFGLGLALIGVVVWVAIAAFAHRDLGFLMVVVGALAGLGVFLALRPTGQAEDEGPEPAWKQRERERRQEKEQKRSDSAPMPPGVKLGLIAAGIALAAIVGGKLAADALTASTKSPTSFRYTDTDMTKMLAEEICKDKQAKGQKLAFPPGITLERAYRPQDFPPGVWEEAEAKWKQTPSAEQQKRIDEEVKKMQDMVKTSASAARTPGFFDRLEVLDFVWLVVGLAAAFVIGMRAKPPAEKEEDE